VVAQVLKFTELLHLTQHCTVHILEKSTKPLLLYRKNVFIARNGSGWTDASPDPLSLSYAVNDIISQLAHRKSLKGIVSRDWAGLQMGSLDRSEFCMTPLEVYF
jgi:hypothetical protein